MLVLALLALATGGAFEGCSAGGPGDGQQLGGDGGDSDREVGGADRDLACFDGSPTHPRLRKLTFTGQVKGQPRVLSLFLEWADEQADLMGGTYILRANGKELVRRVISSPEFRSETPTGTRGSGQVVLDLSGEELPHQGRVVLEVQLFDTHGNPSNRWSLVLRSVRW